MAAYQGSQNASISPTGTATIGAGETKVYTFDEPCADAWVYLAPNSNATIFGNWNSSVASADPDFILSPDKLQHAKSHGTRDLGDLVSSVALYSAAGAVHKTDFFIKGRAAGVLGT